MCKTLNLFLQHNQTYIRNHEQWPTPVKNIFSITLANKNILHTKTIILATGTKKRKLNITGEKEFIGKGVSYCATCDGFYYKNKTVGVIGGSDSAATATLYLADLAEKVYLIYRKKELRAEPFWVNLIEKNPKIKFVWDSVVEDVLGENQVIGVKIKNLKTGQSSTLDCGGLFVAIGHQPNTQLFKDKLEMKNDYIITKDKSSLTNVPGIFACGDVQDHYYRQAVTAAGSGCMAAIDAERYLESLGH